MDSCGGGMAGTGKSILVENLLDIDDDKLELFFESKKSSGGGEVQDVQYYPKSQMAIVTFAEKSDADNVLAFGKPLQLNDILLRVSPFKHQLLVRGLNPNTTLETLNLYFESKKRTNGGEIKDIHPTTERGTVVITYKLCDVAKGVIAYSLNQQLRLDDYDVTVQPAPLEVQYLSPKFIISYLPRNITRDQLNQILLQNKLRNVSEIDIHNERQIAVITTIDKGDAYKLFHMDKLAVYDKSCPLFNLDDSVLSNPTYRAPPAIIVSGLPGDATSEIIELFFSNPTSSGGGEITYFYHNKTQGTATIVYKSTNVVDEILFKHRANALVLAGTSLLIDKLECWIPPAIIHEPTDPFHYLVNNASEVTLDEMNTYLGKKQITASKYLHSFDHDASLLIVSSEPDVRKRSMYSDMTMLTATEPLKGNMITIQKLPERRRVQIYENTVQPGESVLKMLNTPAIQIEKTNDGNGDAVHIVEIANLQDFHRIIFDVYHFKCVYPYYEQIGFMAPDMCPDLPVSFNPNPFTYKPNDQVMKYLNACDEGRHRLDKIASDGGLFMIDWKESKPPYLLIKCQQKTGIWCYNNKRDPRKWQETCESVIGRVLQDVVVKSVVVDQAILVRAAQETKSFLKTHRVSMNVNYDNPALELTGWNDELKPVLESVRNSIVKVQKDTSHVKEKINIHDYEVSLLAPSIKDLTVKIPTLDLKLSGKDNTIRISGLQNDVASAKLQIEQLRRKVVSAAVDNISPLLKEHKTQKYICDSLKLQGVNVELVSIKGSLTIHSLSAEDVKTARCFIRTCIKTFTIPLGKKSLRITDWKELKKRLQEAFDGLLNISETKQAVEVICVESIAKVVSDMIENIIKKSIITHESISLTEMQKVLFEKRIGKEKLKEIQMSFESGMETIEIAVRNSNLELSSPGNIINDILTKIRAVISAMYSEECPVEEPWMQRYFSEKENIQEVEDLANGDVAIENIVSREDGADRVVKSDNIMKLKNGMGINVIWGNIATIQVDAIVNTPRLDMNPYSTAVSKAICEAGGPIMVAEMKQLKGVTFGNVYITGPGKLAVKRVYHLPVAYSTGKSSEEVEKTLSRALTTCFIKANEDEIRSLALPAIGSGSQLLSCEVVAECIIRGVESIAGYKSNSSLKQITIVIYDKSNTKTMTDYQRVFQNHSEKGPDAVHDVRSKLKIPIDHDRPQSNILHVQPQPMEVSDKDSIVYKSGLTLELKIGSITDQKVDVIVNTGPQNLQLSGAGYVSNRILKEGGKCIQDEINRALKPKQGSLQYGEVLMTRAGKLPSKFIYHGTFPDVKSKIWQKNLKSYIRQILKKASDERLSSIAIPAIGTGQLRYPSNIVAKIMLEVVEKHSIENVSSTLKSVYIVLFERNPEVIQNFRDVLRQTYTSATPSIPVQPATGGSQRHFSELEPGIYQLMTGPIRTTIKKGDITEQDVDVIVCTTNTTLDSSRGVAATIINAGGSTILDEFTDIVRRREPHDKYDNIVVTNAGTLKCRRIFHIILPAETDMWNVCMINLLEEAANMKVTSIAVQFFGTGDDGEDVYNIAETMLSSFENFVQIFDVKHPRLVDIIVPTEDIVTVFRNCYEVSRASPLTSILDETYQDFDKETLTLRIHAFESVHIDIAKKFIKERISEKTDGETISDRLLLELTPRQIEDVKRNCASKGMTVDFHLNKDEPFVKLKGQRKDVKNMRKEIEDLLKSEEAAKEYSFGMHTDKGFEAFSKEMFHKIFVALKTNKEEITCTDDNNKYQIDLRNSKVYRKGETFSLDKRMLNVERVPLPADWTNIPEGKEKINSIPLDDKSTEYIFAKNKFSETCKDEEVLKIERIQNPDLYKSYQVKKQAIENRCPPDVQVERYLFHGTSADVIDSINTNGFNRSYCGKNATKYGKGVYFAVNAKFSTKYVDKKKTPKLMYLCQVLTGEYALGHKKYIVPPPRNPANPTIAYDSCIDQEKDPNMFVVFYDNQAYPKYLITYK